MAGYSGKSLVEKLGIKPGTRVMIVHPPDDYDEILVDVPDDVNFLNEGEGQVDLIQLFVTETAELRASLPRFLKLLSKTGTLWISWPKKTSKLAGDLNENDVRDIGLAAGVVDVKVAAVDDDWSGLKFVFRIKDR